MSRAERGGTPDERAAIAARCCLKTRRRFQPRRASIPLMPVRAIQGISRLGQKRVLSSPVRQELLDVLARVGKASLAELGALLGRPADGLYYHVRMLARAGLVRSAGVRARAGHREALFRATARQYAVRYTPASTPHLRAMNDIVSAMMRLGIRDFRRALAGGASRVDGPERDLRAMRTTGWLQGAHVRQVNRNIGALAKTVSRHDPRGRLYAVTVLLTPLDHRANRTGRRPRGRR
jgi:hypothetical protein